MPERGNDRPCQAKTTDGEPCPEVAAWLYHVSSGGVMRICDGHVERLKARLGDRLVEGRLRRLGTREVA